MVRACWHITSEQLAVWSDDDDGEAVVDPDDGARVGLNDGAEVGLDDGSVVDPDDDGTAVEGRDDGATVSSDATHPVCQCHTHTHPLSVTSDGPVSAVHERVWSTKEGVHEMRGIILFM